MTRRVILSAVELAKPVTWFPPIWAFGCGVISTGLATKARWPEIIAGALLAGPLVCATSQVANEWFDRHVDAINEPNRPIPSGRVKGRWPINLAVIWSALSLAVAIMLGPVVFWATVLALVLAWAYSAPPLRLKRNGWLGNTACALSYEGIAWFTGAAVMTGAAVPEGRTIALAALYSAGAHGIMTLNDFKSIEGDRQTGIKSLPAQYGVQNAALLACTFMALPQVVVIALLWKWGRPDHAIVVGMLLAVQALLMAYFLADPKKRATMFSALGVSAYVAGMLASALAVASLSKVSS
jgi:chlorophyll/bacteriochlorophyll a synthase